jgi:hypothetical protein
VTGPLAALLFAALTPLSGDLAADFACEVNMRLEVPADEQQRYAREIEAAFEAAKLAGLAPQHVLVVDRAPKVQAALLYRLLPGGNWAFTGAAPASTGLPGAYEHFETPLGVFAHTLENPDFRAEGTCNEFGIRGYGREGMRVFDLGWVDAPKSWGNRAPSVMRLQLHATDPDRLEGWLGARRSKGCIRVPASFVEFLDRRGVLDADYEDAAQAGMSLWILRPQREATRWPGRYVIVVDTGRAERPAWSPAPNGRAWRSPRDAACER